MAFKNAGAAALALPLRELLENRFPDATPVTHRTAEPVATGIAALDAILPGGGLPRGRLTVWAPEGGATAILRAASQATVINGERAVWIDGLGTIAGPFWEEGPVLVRPKNRKEGLRASEELLRCGGFALVVVAGIEPEGMENVRLSRAAREGGGALVTLTPHTSMASLRVSSRILSESYRWRRNPFGEPATAEEARVHIRANSLGWSRGVDIPIAVVPADLRISLDPGLVDRRGLTRKSKVSNSRKRELSAESLHR